MTAVFVILALLVVGAVAVVAGGRGGGLGDGGSDRPGPWLPVDRAVTPDDVDSVHFGVGFRGYRMDEVDLVLDRLATELRERDARLAAYESRVTGHAPTVPAAAVAQAAPAPQPAPPAPAPPAREPVWPSPDWPSPDA